MKCLSVLAAILVATSSLAQAPASEICVTVDEARDTLPPMDRAAALLLVKQKFEVAGWRVITAGCSMTYTVSHVRLGNTVTVTITGTEGSREGTALGLDDLPALYSQMVRSIVTGRPMTGFNVVDRSNVTASQASSLRTQSEPFTYVRLGYGTVLGDPVYGGTSLGFGRRFELDSFAIDVSFFNVHVTAREKSSGATAASLLKLQGLYFINHKANKSAYVGGGLGYGAVDVKGRWHGSGLQGELTAGYEFPRASSLRIFVQADATLPFYRARPHTSSMLFAPATPTGKRYIPGFAVSLGLGWQRNRRATTYPPTRDK